MWCFVHFDFEMCFAPQRPALFRHLNCQKCSGAEVFCTFSLGNVLRATTACTFSTSQLPKVVRRWGVLYIFTWKCASRHSHTHHLSLSHTIFYIQLCHTQLCFTSRSSTTFFVVPSFPGPATTLLCAYYWKKLSCGVIRSFNIYTHGYSHYLRKWACCEQRWSAWRRPGGSSTIRRSFGPSSRQALAHHKNLLRNLCAIFFGGYTTCTHTISVSIVVALDMIESIVSW